MQSRDNYNPTCCPTSSGTSRFVDEILEKYNCGSSTGNFFPTMSSETLTERLASLKGHAFSNANSQSVNWDQANCREGSKIDLSNNTPGCMLTNSDSKCNQSGFTIDLSRTSNPRDNVEEGAEVTRISNSRNEGETLESVADLVSCANPGRALSERNRVDVSDGFAFTSLSCSNYLSDRVDSLCSDHSKTLDSNPVVVITPAMADAASDECVDFINSKNGELTAAMLKDTTCDSCSLSSLCSCSENEILTDDEPSEDDIKPVMEDNSDKVRFNALLYFELVGYEVGKLVHMYSLVRYLFTFCTRNCDNCVQYLTAKSPSFVYFGLCIG